MLGWLSKQKWRGGGRIPGVLACRGPGKWSDELPWYMVNGGWFFHPTVLGFPCGERGYEAALPRGK